MKNTRTLEGMPLFATLLLLGMAANGQILPATKNINASIGDELVKTIRATQTKYVRDSWGEKANQSFTDLDLEKFYADRILDRISNELKSDKRFAPVAQTIRSLPAQQRDEILDRAAKIYKPTWEQLGKIDRSGQTDAGQKAEREIARTIVALIKDGQR